MGSGFLILNSIDIIKCIYILGGSAMLYIYVYIMAVIQTQGSGVLSEKCYIVIMYFFEHFIKIV